MKIYLGADHAGFVVKEKVKTFLQEKGYDTQDCGAYSFDHSDDYPDFISKAAAAVSKDPLHAKGIILGGSGQGEAMVANKFKGVRCALFYAPRIPPHPTDVHGHISNDPYEMLKLTRVHNNANMLSLGVRLLTDDEIVKAIELFLTTPFPGDPRHVRRIEEMSEIEDELRG
jgi:ribose 5-phosphate isomerase B